MVFAVALAAFGCGKTEDTSKAEPGAAAKGAMVTVPKAGKKLEPAIKPDKLPSGAWYCDMGTVHYARMDEGDKTCPVCKMKLKQKP